MLIQIFYIFFCKSFHPRKVIQCKNLMISSYVISFEITHDSLISDAFLFLDPGFFFFFGLEFVVRR